MRIITRVATSSGGNHTVELESGYSDLSEARARFSGLLEQFDLGSLEADELTTQIEHFKWLGQTVVEFTIIAADPFLGDVPLPPFATSYHITFRAEDHEEFRPLMNTLYARMSDNPSLCTREMTRLLALRKQPSRHRNSLRSKD